LILERRRAALIESGTAVVPWEGLSPFGYLTAAEKAGRGGTYLLRDRTPVIEIPETVLRLTPPRVIRCTGKLLKEIGRPRPEFVRADEEATWCANLLRIERRKCLIITHHSTLFTLFVPDLVRAQIRMLPEILALFLNRAMRNEGLRLEQNVEPETIALARTTSRSVLGSMNDLAFQCSCHIEAEGGLLRYDRDGLIRRINRVPMSAIDYDYAIDQLRRLTS
jgi:hypothetical protein